MRLRYEDFGAIAALDDPPALVQLDRALVTELGYPASPLWGQPHGHLSAPTEVHLMVTNRCAVACPGCYTEAGPEGAELDEAALRGIVERLAEAQVFHLALGGGESLLHAALFRVAAYARALGVVPNLTTSGLGLTPAVAEACQVFGQVNVSLDGLDAVYARSRGYDGAPVALRALERLSAAGVPAGVNCILDRHTWHAAEAVVAAVAERGGNQVEFLRYKPAGRGTAGYADRALTEAQGRQMAPMLLALGAAHPSVEIKIDCSLVPFLCAADPAPEALTALGVLGCEAGHALAAVTAEGAALPCSFVHTPVGDVAHLMDHWHTDPTLEAWRTYPERAPAPCAQCRYRAICKGGCKVVTQHLEGRWFAPDPECPRVRAHRRGERFVPTVMHVD
jgi:radical SAM protein with 4Fe4S-binding SPASM domain